MNNNLLPQITILNDERIENYIFNIRGQHVMLDSDVAFFFGVTVSSLNRQMRRNVDRFPSDFCFQLSDKETNDLRCQKGTTNFLSSKRRYNPYAYTEEGIITLAGVLKNDTAAKMSVEIARKFIQMRKFIMENSDFVLSLAKLQNRQLEFENETNRRFEQVFKLIEKLDLPKTTLFYNEEWYDAFDYIVDIIRRAKKSIILIDPYCDNKALSFLKYKNSGVNLLICNGPKSKLEREEILRFKSQYGVIKVKTTKNIHDRFLIIDEEECYDLGTSLNYAGKKIFAINKISNINVIKEIVKISEYN